MSERIWTVAEPLTPGEQSERLDPQTTIEIKGTFARNVIKREWVRDHAGEGAQYGYAEYRTTEKRDHTQLAMNVPFALDVPKLTQVILVEIERQRAGARVADV